MYVGLLVVVVALFRNKRIVLNEKLNVDLDIYYGEKIKEAEMKNDKTTIIHGLYSKSMAKFEVFHWVISSSMNF